MRRGFLGLLPASLLAATGPGDKLRRPQNAPVAQQTPIGIQPGTNSVTIAHYVIIFGASGGVFVYIGTPGLGNPPVEWMASGTTDPYGNPLVSPGVGSTNGGTSTVMNGGVLNFFLGAVNAGDLVAANSPATTGFAIEVIGGADFWAPKNFYADKAAFVAPSGDTTGAKDLVAIQAALNGGLCILSGGGGSQYWVNAPLTMPTGALFDGGGAIVSPAGGGGFAFTPPGGILQLASGAVQNTTVRDIVFQDTWSVASLNGVYYNSANSVPNNFLRHVTVRGFTGDGFLITASANSASCHLTDCVAYRNLGDGFACSSDDLLVNCEAGQNMGHGFHFTTASSNCYATNCLAWWNGWNPQTSTWPGSGTSCGYFIDNNSQYIRLTGCWAQQNGLHGYAVGATSGGAGFTFKCGINGGGGDTNSAYAAGVGNGVFVSGAFGGVFSSITGGNNAGLSPGSQLWGIQAQGTLTNSYFADNTISGTSGNNDVGASWIPMTLINGWVAGTGVAPKYRPVGDPASTVQVIGTINGAASTSAVFANLPSPYRVTSTQSFRLNDTTLAAAGQFFGQADSTGNLTVEGGVLTNAYTFGGDLALDA